MVHVFQKSQKMRDPSFLFKKATISKKPKDNNLPDQICIYDKLKLNEKYSII